MYSSLFWNNNSKNWAEMTPQEQKMCIIAIVIMVVIFAGVLIYEHFKKEREE